MKEINKLRLLAGIPIDAAAEKTVIKEARDVPKRREELTQVNEKTMKARVGGVQSAIKHTLNAIKALEKVPATDYNGEIQHAIAELEGVLNDEDSGAGLNTILTAYEKAQRKHSRGEKAKVRQEEEEARALEMSMAEEEELEYEEVSDDMPEEEMPDEMPEDKMPEEEPGKFDDEMGDDMHRDDWDKDDMRDEYNEKRSRRHRNRNRMDETKAAKDYDGDGEVESEKEEHKGVVDKAIKKKEKKEVDESVHSYDGWEEDETKPVNATDGKANKDQVWDEDENEKDSDQEQATDDMEEKMAIPAGIKQALRTEIEQAKKESKKQEKRDKEASYFYNDLANAFETLLGHLDKGTIYEMKLAQVFAQSLMGPMLHKLPTEVWKFIANGGKARSLKSVMIDVSKTYPKTGPQNK